MEITKIFTFEGSHIVRNCTSRRCSHSVHGHSYKVEVTIESATLDNAQMVMDFGLMKGSIKSLIDAFDHTHLICTKESKSYKKFFKENNERWIELPFNPSAEMLSLCLIFMVELILTYTQFNNGESSDIHVKSVTVHETATGRATSYEEDLDNLWDIGWCRDILFSPELIAEMPDDLKRLLMDPEDYYIVNPKVEKQISL